MRLELSIPNTVYSQAQRIAKQSGLSVERFVLDALRLHMESAAGDEGAVVLSPEQVAAVHAAQEDVKAGRVFTPSEIRAHFQAKHEGWPDTRT